MNEDIEATLTQMRTDVYNFYNEKLAQYALEVTNPVDGSKGQAVPHFISFVFIPIIAADGTVNEAVSLTSSLPSEVVPITMLQFLAKMQEDGKKFESVEVPVGNKN